jgi:hypothetical protein
MAGFCTRNTQNLPILLGKLIVQARYAKSLVLCRGFSIRPSEQPTLTVHPVCGVASTLLAQASSARGPKSFSTARGSALHTTTSADT